MQQRKKSCKNRNVQKQNQNQMKSKETCTVHTHTHIHKRIISINRQIKHNKFMNETPSFFPFKINKQTINQIKNHINFRYVPPGLKLNPDDQTYIFISQNNGEFKIQCTQFSLIEIRNSYSNDTPTARISKTRA